MVAFLPLLYVGLTSLTLAFLLYPRLPHYSFKIRSVSPRWFSGQGFRAKLGAKVELKNDNYIAIDIHALSFDIYYADWWGETQLLANVQDTRMRETSQAYMLPYTGAVEDEIALASKELPIWQLQPKKFFATYDYVLMEPIGGLGTIASLAYDMIRNGGVAQVRSTGSIHFKANGQIPLTMNILCDNILDGFTLEMQGVYCELHRLDLGWKDIPTEMKVMGDMLLMPNSELGQKRKTIENRHIAAM